MPTFFVLQRDELDKWDDIPEVIGVYSSAKKAHAAWLKFQSDWPGNVHSYTIIEFVLNAPAAFEHEQTRKQFLLEKKIIHKVVPLKKQ